MRSHYARRSTGILTFLVLALVVAGPAQAGKPPPDTTILTGPTTPTTSRAATFTFQSTQSKTSFTCQLDAGAASSCTSPKSYSAVPDGTHTFSVYGTVGGVRDPSPSTWTWKVDTTGPTAPALAATTPTPTSVALTWSASSDGAGSGVAGYTVVRDGTTTLATLGVVASYSDNTVTPASTHTYKVTARDVLGNVSAASNTVTATTPPATASAPTDSHLTRSPYLSDLVGLNAAVNFATDRSAGAASIHYGAVSGGSCSLTTSVGATRITVAVGNVYEYQWKAKVTLPAAGTYCYRVYLGATDLLAANASPRFTTQVTAGSSESFSFDVFGDWGSVDANGDNAIQGNLMQQIANSGARFALTVGDNGYPAGSQLNYGDLQQKGADTSAVFGPTFWPVPGKSIALFPAIGNHGLARSDAVHPQFANWPQDAAVGTSSGRYQMDTYPSVNGSTEANYPSPWYAFDAGSARFYVLDVAWADQNVGNSNVYANEAASHWSLLSAEYLWLKADLEAHPSGLKFAVWHYPLYSDQPSEASDPYLQGSGSLEGLLASHGVNIAFNGHAHIYQRNAAAPGGLISYVTGGGGAQAQSTGTCSAIDQYAIGWSYTSNQGTSCGAATSPTSDAQVYHFLKVTVAGNSVTVTPTDSNGRTFDVQTYTFAPLPDTYVDTVVPPGTTTTSQTFAFHASGTPATFSCSLDGAAATACTSPVTYDGLAETAHTFTVTATVSGTADPLPATVNWTVDGTAPSAPTGLTATTPSPFSVALTWDPATDNTGVTGYNLYRDGALYQSLGAVTSYTDNGVLGSSTHSYAVLARDVSNNTSALSGSVSATTPPPPVPVFADGFESGTLNAWTPKSGLVVQGTTVHTGSQAVEGNTTTGATYAKKTLPSTYSDAYARVWFNVLSQVDQVNLLRMRDSAGVSLGYVYVDATGALALHDDATGMNTVSTTSPAPGWHAVEMHLKVAAAAGGLGTAEVWLDNVLIGDLSSTSVNVGSTPIGAFQIGEVQSGLTYDVALDDAAFATSRLGPVVDTTPPSVPANVAATAPTPFAAQVSWDASTDDVAVAGYDVLRDGGVVGQVGATPGYTDTGVAPGSTHNYAVRATDFAGNSSAVSPATSVTLPASAAPVFADGFESGDLTAWTSSAGLVVTSAAGVRSGTYAAWGNTAIGNTVAKKTLGATYGDAYLRLGYKLNSQGTSSPVNLLRVRNASQLSIGYVYLDTTGHLSFRSDIGNTNTVTTLVPGAGWHTIELHVTPAGAGSSTVEVWLDGAAVPALATNTANLGANPVGAFQIGEVQAGRSYDVVFDDAAFSASRIGL